MQWRLASPAAFSLQKNRFGSKCDAKFGEHIRLYCSHGPFDIITRGATAIDQHQRLLLVHTDRAEIFPFPAGLFDQPAGGQFDSAIRLRVLRQGGVGGFELLRLLCGDDGIVEKTAAVGNVRRVGQFALANGDDRLRNVLRAGGVDFLCR